MSTHNVRPNTSYIPAGVSLSAPQPSNVMDGTHEHTHVEPNGSQPVIGDSTRT